MTNLYFSNTMTWRRGFHRLFAVLWVIWAFFVLVVSPIQEAKQAQASAAFYYARWAEIPIKDESDRVERDKENKERWKHASLSHIYKTEMIPNLHWVLLLIILPPALLYGLIRGTISFCKWLYNGFHAA
jgi:hypothetical protein